MALTTTSVAGIIFSYWCGVSSQVWAWLPLSFLCKGILKQRTYFCKPHNTDKNKHIKSTKTTCKRSEMGLQGVTEGVVLAAMFATFVLERFIVN